MRNPDRWSQYVIMMASLILGGMLVAKGETFSAFFVEQTTVFAAHPSSANGDLQFHAIVESARNADLRWPDFAPYKAEVVKFYEMNNNSLVWSQNGRVRPQGLAVIDLLRHANSQRAGGRRLRRPALAKSTPKARSESLRTRPGLV